MTLAEIITVLWGVGMIWFSVYQIRNDRFYYRSLWGVSTGWITRSCAPLRFRAFTTFQFIFGLFLIWASLSHNVGFKGSFLKELFTTPLF